MEKKRIANYALVSTAVASVLLTGCGEAKKIDKYFAEGDYSEAVDFYERTSMSDKEKAKLQENLKKRLENALNGYLKGEVKEKEADKILKAVTEMDIDAISDFTVEATSNFKLYKESKQAYENGKNYEEADNLEAAYKAYAAVLEEDSNYEKASKKAEGLKKQIKEKVSAKIEEYKQKDRYDSAFSLLDNSYKLTGLEDFATMNENLKKEYLKSVETKVDEYIAEEKFYYAQNALIEANHLTNWSTSDQKTIDDLLAKVEEARAYAEYKNNRDSLYDTVEHYMGYSDPFQGYRYAFERVDNFVSMQTYAEKDEEFKTYLADLEKKFVQMTLDKCAAYTDNGSYKRPAVIIAQAKEIRDLADFTAKLAEYEKVTTEYLFAIEEDSKSSITKYSDDKDNVVTTTAGKEYYVDSTSILMNSKPSESYSSAEDASIKVKLDGSYKKVSGVFATVNGLTDAEKEELERQQEAESVTTGGTTTEVADGETAPEGTENTEGAENTEAPEGTENPEETENTETENPEGEDAEEDGAEEGEEDGEEIDHKTAKFVITALVGEEEKVLLEQEILGSMEETKMEVNIEGATEITIEFKEANKAFSALLLNWALEK